MKANLLLIVFLIFMVIKVIGGYKKGVVKEIISLITILILSIVGVLLAFGIKSYNGGHIIQLTAAVILLVLISTAHHFLRIIFFSAKVVVKLPVISSADKMLGAVFGVAETLVVLWLCYILLTVMDTGNIGQLILTYTEDSKILTWLYTHNFLRTLGGTLG